MDPRTSTDIKDYFRVLDVPEDASAEDIERQYERLSRLYQPGRMDDPEDRAYAAAKLAEIEEAYLALSNTLQQEARTSASGLNDGSRIASVQDTRLYCANHPDVETLLRCNRCNKPICMKCAIQTPVGYRCRECVNAQQNAYYNAVSTDNIVAFGVGFLVAALAAPLIGVVIRPFGLFLGLFIAFIGGSAAGSALAQVIRRSIGRRRGRYLPLFALFGIILGVLVGNFVFLLFTGTLPLFSLSMLLFTGLAIASAYPQLR